MQALKYVNFKFFFHHHVSSWTSCLQWDSLMKETSILFLILRLTVRGFLSRPIAHLHFHSLSFSLIHSFIIILCSFSSAASCTTAMDNSLHFFAPRPFLCHFFCITFFVPKILPEKKAQKKIQLLFVITISGAKSMKYSWTKCHEEQVLMQNE